MTELLTQEAIQTQLLTLDIFDAGDVVINDWTILDQSTAKAPYVIIQNADSLDVVSYCETEYEMPITIIEAWTDWEDSLNAFRDTREAVLGALKTISYVSNITNGSDIGEVRDKYNTDINAMPVFLSQVIIISIRDVST